MSSGKKPPAVTRGGEERQRDDPRSREAAEEAARPRSGRSLDSGDSNGDEQFEQAAEGKPHNAVAHRDDPRSGEAAEEATRHE